MNRIVEKTNKKIVTRRMIKISAAVLLLFIAAMGTASALTPQEQLGKLLFFDKNLSTPEGQGCVSCHAPATGFADPRNDRGVSPGIISGRFGNRNAPTAAYQAFNPDFAFVLGEFVGGQFWDQRAANLTGQAKGPFLNPLEMNNPDEAAVLSKILNASYSATFTALCGAQPYPDGQYTCMAEAIAAFEKTSELNKFNSKFDLDQANLTVQEKRGLLLFDGKGTCVACHAIGLIPSMTVFTDFDAHNIGVPSNLGMMGDGAALQNYFPFYYPPLVPEFNPAGLNFTDIGLAGNTNIPLVDRPGVRGAMKTPTLRNVNLTAPYMHNGVFRTLKEVVHFYNTRDLLGNCAFTQNPQVGVNCWPAPEIPVNVNQLVGNLELTDGEENDIVAFLQTLTDDYVPPPAPTLTDKQLLGQNLFTDASLSTPAGQGCVSCHDPSVAFTDLDSNMGVSQGANISRFGNRNAPSNMYSAFSPDFVFFGGVFVGGQFWDQRAANLTEQAKGPFLNKLEMNNTDPAEVLSKIKSNVTYSNLFNETCGNETYPDGQYTCMASAIAAFENTPVFNKFSSKFDRYQANLTMQELRGFTLFNGKGNCALCHGMGPTPSTTLFTDFDAENIGVPSNRGMLGDGAALQNYFPFYYPPLVPEFNPVGLNFTDIGLGGSPNPNVDVIRPLVTGMMKAPTLRNINLTAPYMHNGVFRTLEEVVHFYNTRDILGNCASTVNLQPGVNCWPAPEVLANMNPVIGNLQLTATEESDIVAFLKTLTDNAQQPPAPSGPTAQEELGKFIFEDTSLSEPAGQACQSCHDPAVAFTEPDKDRGVSAGAVTGKFGNRNAPSNMYSAFSPDLSLAGGIFAGGQFWDQRAANLVEQAKGPFLNPLEMNNPDSAAVLNKIQNNPAYNQLFNTTCGVPDLNNPTDVDLKYTCMAEAIAAYENTPVFNRFSSKFDLDPANLTLQEKRGLLLFSTKGTCAVCHPISEIPSRSLFTDFDAENIGVPSNLGMLGNTTALQHYFPFYFTPAGQNFIDTGLALNDHVPMLMKPQVRGMVKAPTLRNVALTAPYMHNGVFRNLKEVVHFYNTRNTLGNCANTLNPHPGVNCWPAPEVLANMNALIGDLQLTDAEENDIVAFLLTLTDGYPQQQAPSVISITVSPNPGTVLSNQTFTATGRDVNGNIVTITPTWSSSNTSVGTIDQAGVFTAVSPGTAIVDATNGFVSGGATVTVIPTPPPLIANITAFDVGSGIRAGTIKANVTVQNLDSAPHKFAVVVSGLNARGYPLAGTGVIVNLPAGESTRIPVRVTVPPTSDLGSYSLYAGVYPFDDELLIPTRLTGIGGPAIAVVSLS